MALSALAKNLCYDAAFEIKDKGDHNKTFEGTFTTFTLLTLCLIQRLEAPGTVLQFLTAQRLKYLSKIKTTRLKKGSFVATAASVWPHAVVAHRDLNISDNDTCAGAR